MKKAIYIILALTAVAALSLYVFSSRKAHSLTSFDADSSGWIVVDVMKGGLSLRKIAHYDKILFPHHSAFIDGKKIIFSVSGEGTGLRFSYDAADDKVSYVFFEPGAEKELKAFSNETDTVSVARNVYLLDKYTIEQNTKPGCIDTTDTTLLIKEGDKEVMRIFYLGNIAMYKADLNGDGFREIYLVNAYECEGLFEVFRIDRATGPPR